MSRVSGSVWLARPRQSGRERDQRAENNRQGSAAAWHRRFELTGAVPPFAMNRMFWKQQYFPYSTLRLGPAGLAGLFLGSAHQRHLEHMEMFRVRVKHARSRGNLLLDAFDAVECFGKPALAP